MTLAELRAACERSIAEPDQGRILLTLPRPMSRKGRMRLFGRDGGPTGRAVGETAPGRTLVDFDAREVLAFVKEREVRGE